MDHPNESLLAMKQDDGNSPRRTTKIFGVLLALLVIVSLVMSVVTMVIFFNKQENKQKQPCEPVEYCLPCSNLRSETTKNGEPSDFIKGLGKRPDENGVEQCCAVTKEQKIGLTQMVLKKLSNKTSESSPKAAGLMSMPSSFSNSLAFAQKSLHKDPSYSFKSNIPDNSLCMLNIDPDRESPRYEIKKGVDLSSTGIHVKHQGLYFVYKSINFYPDSGEPCKDFDDPVFRSVLIRNSGAQQQVLITSEHTCCPECTRDSETGFAGGVFQLDVGDIIQVNVTGAGVVHVSRDVTYVGLMMMGGRTG